MHMNYLRKIKLKKIGAITASAKIYILIICSFCSTKIGILLMSTIKVQKEKEERVRFKRGKKLS